MKKMTKVISLVLALVMCLALCACGKKDASYKMLDEKVSTEQYAIGFKKGNTELKNKINNAITDMIQDGSWQRAISDNTRGVAYTPNAKYNPPVPNGKGNK